jgi:hypothetical protein
MEAQKWNSAIETKLWMLDQALNPIELEIMSLTACREMTFIAYEEK